MNGTLRALAAVVLPCSLLCGGRPGRAAVRLPALFSHHMVLQREARIAVWGWADPGEEVTVRVAGREAAAVAGPQGNFRMWLKPLRAGGPHTLTVTGHNTISVTNVLVGDVWLASGQSNMQMTVGGCRDAEREVAAADYPAIRQFRVAVQAVFEAPEDVEGSWTVCSPRTVRAFSGAAYFFARDLHRARGVPIGIVNSSLGATRIQTWISREALAAIPECRADLTLADHVAANRAELETEYEEALRDYQRRWATNVVEAVDEATARRMADPALDAGDWPEMTIPGNWEQGGLPGFDGVVWFHRDADVPASWAGKDLTLYLGPVDEMDVTWFNGVRVGGMGSLSPLDVSAWSVPRQYRVEGSLVRAGRNVIRIRAIDTRGHGGLWGQQPHQLRIERADGRDEPPLSLAGPWRYRPGTSLPAAPSKPFHPNLAGVLFNGMIRPLVRYGIKGVIWYQGESNVGQAGLYGRLLPALIEDWRGRWRASGASRGDWPFLFVQLPNYRAPIGEPSPSSWAELREAQLKTLSVPATAMAVTIDIGDALDIHPGNKQDVGRRLALAARAVAYGERRLVHSGPIVKAMRIEGSRARLVFTHVAGGLVAKGGPLGPFAIAGDDRRFVWAQAEIAGDTVVVWSDRVAKPVAVRYAWADNPEGCNLCNTEGLPASPFRTDEWPGPFDAQTP